MFELNIVEKWKRLILWEFSGQILQERVQFYTDKANVSK